MRQGQWQLKVFVPMVVAGIAMVGCAKHPGGAGKSSSFSEGSVVAVPAAQHDWASRPVPSEFVAHPALKDVFFDFDRYEVRESDAKTLDKTAAWLREHPGHQVLIEGHTDERGTNEYNVVLGDRRAKSTLNYLASRGVPAGRIAVVSYGEERPSCGQHSEKCWAKNRRARFLVKAQ